MIHRKVRFQGKEYWYHADDNGFCEAMISPLDHYSDSGELLADPLRDISFAIVEGDDIMRFGYPIGKITELEDVNE